MNEIFVIAKPAHLTAAAKYLARGVLRGAQLGFLALATGARMTPLGNNRALIKELSARSRRLRAPK